HGAPATLYRDHGGCGRWCGAWEVRRGSAGTHAQPRTSKTKDLQRDPGTVTPQAPLTTRNPPYDVSHSTKRCLGGNFPGLWEAPWDPLQPPVFFAPRSSCHEAGTESIRWGGRAVTSGAP